ncbi:S-layer homology domain-containing protein [Lysinibacillus capsici]|uniref:S-layer homology domain-containing protein n=1 Tax=Lysinibacillus capsici TaxID=2115968 RepID=UPI0027319414|nr:S-layer homology domain-containing protein [Lysinibacillus capsici]MDP1396071.1 S-layer homology domain-containing protein [Lysinibacillus capsici]
MQTKKQQKWWKRPLNTLLATALVASSVSFMGTPQEVKAASAAGPGGVSEGLISWVDVERSKVITTGTSIDTLTDLVDEGIWGTYSPSPAKSPYIPNAINFNGGIDPRKGFYTRAQAEIGSTLDSEREVFSVQVNEMSNGKEGFPWEFGGKYNTLADYGSKNVGAINTYFGRDSGNLNITIDDYDLKNGAILNVWSATDDWALLLNGKTLSTQDMNTPQFDSPTTNPVDHYYFGAGHSTRLQGKIAETIVFDRKLDDGKRKQVNSYLALKYGLTLTDDYIASDGATTMWTAANNLGYGSHITGIGRDDNGALYQKQSKSQVNGANVTIALGNEIKATNAENLNTITNDKSFFTFSDNGQAATFATPLTKDDEQLQHTERIYKVEKNNWQDADITLQVDKVYIASEWPLYFVISEDSQFDTSDSFRLLTDGKVTLNSNEFANGAYFTIAAPVPQYESAALEQAQAGGNQITLTFDQDVVLTNGTGFTITIGGNTITNATFNVDPNDAKKVIITLPNGTDITGKEVTVKYDATQGNLKGKNGVPVSDFEESIVNKTALQAKVTEEGTLTEVNYTPASWTEYQAKLAEAKAVLAKPDATQVEIDAALAALTKAQNDLVPVSGVDKTALQAKVTEESALTEVNYTPASWTEYQAKLVEAKAVLAKSDATQAEVDAALAALTKAQNDLDPVSGVDKAALQAKVAEESALTEVNYTPASWTEYQAKLVEAKAVLAKPDATQAEVDAALAALTKAQKALTKNPLPQTPGLGSLVSSQGALSPSFSSEVTDYTMNVGYATSELSFFATTVNPGATVTTTVNGQPGTLGQIPLQVGENIIVITVTDTNGNVRTYTIKVYREAYTGGGGGTWTPDPTPPTTNPGTTTTIIKVELEIDGDNPLQKTTLDIERTKHANGEVTDFVNLTPAQALEAVEKAKQISNSIARIVIPDVNDEVDKVTVEIPKQSLQTLRDNGLSLEISTENGHIAIPHSSMEGIDDNFFFRLVPVKKESERQAIEERAKAVQVVRETLQINDVRVVARPMTIETNMPSRPVQVTLSLKGVNVPTEAAARQAFLEQLAVFIEHSDGEKKVVFSEVVTMTKGELGLRFTVDKFSTFTIIQFEKAEVSEHEAYIKGFQNGTFGPDKNVTRAQVAIMMARILGYTEGQVVDKAPFKDVAKNHSAAGAIVFVKEQGIMNGDNYGNFHANANITRAEMAAVIANYKQLSVKEGVAITFKDTKGHWAQWLIEANRAAGIINGLEDGSFVPNAALTRAQAVVMMNRMFERGPLHGVTKTSFPDVKASHWAFKEIEEAANSHKYFIDEDGKEQLSN